MTGTFLFSSSALAAAGDPQWEALRAKYNFQDPLGGVTVAVLVGKIISQFLPLVGALFLLLFIWSGILWMIAGGDKTKVEKATKTMRNAVIGMAIVIGAYMIVSVALNVGSTVLNSGTGS